MRVMIQGLDRVRLRRAERPGGEALGLDVVFLHEAVHLAQQIAVAGRELLNRSGIGVAGFLEGVVDALHVFGEADIFLVDFAYGIKDVVEDIALVFEAPDLTNETQGGQQSAGADEDGAGAGGSFE